MKKFILILKMCQQKGIKFLFITAVIHISLFPQSTSVDLEKLFIMEEQIEQLLTQYKETLEDKVHIINEFLQADYSVKPHLSEEPSLLQTFRLISRLSQKMPNIDEKLFTDNLDFLEKYQSIVKNYGTFPKENDITELVISILRLQLTYNLNISDMVNGYLLNIQTGPGLSIHDCFVLGKYAYDNKLFSTYIEFLSECHKMAKNDLNSGKYLEKIESLLKKAKEIHKEDIKNGENDKKALFAHYLVTEDNIENQFPQNIYNHSDILEISKNYVKLCQGQELRKPDKISKLKCYYFNGPTSYCKISPLKMEIHSISPPIIQFYEIFSENQIKMILKKAKPEIKRARVKNVKNLGQASLLRQAGTMWIYDQQIPDDIEKFGWVSKKIQNVVNLNVLSRFSSEDLQIANYAPGGFYTSHYDCVHEDTLLDYLSDEEIFMGERLATFMIYLSDVQAGGCTVFPKLGVRVEPIFRSALFWYNLNPDLSINRQTLHSGCPIILGEKWLGNKWIRSNSQIFTRKCPNDALSKPTFDLKSIGFNLFNL